MTSRSRAFSLDGSMPVVLRDLGADPRSVLRRAELPEDLFSRQGASLPTPEYFRLWRAVEQEVDDPTLPIRLTEVIRAEAFHPSIFAALCSSNLSVAIRRIATYKRLCAPMELTVTEDLHSLTLALGWLDRTVDPPTSLATFEVLFFLQLARMATRERVVPLRIEVPRPPKPAARYTALVGIAIERSDRLAITFSAGDAQRPFLTANEAMWTMFEPSLRQRLAELDESASFAERVRASLLEALPGGESSMEEVAKRLGVSKRTLQRRLQEEDTSFQAVLNATREALARYYLTNTKLSGAEISYLLGFADPNSFFRAFHDWTGETTEQARMMSAH